MNTAKQKKLKNKIEKLDQIHQVKILDILISNQIKYSENRNGIFLNMKDLNKKTIKEITEYLKYIEIQQKQLDTDENIKKTYANDYFNDNKEKGV